MESEKIKKFAALRAAHEKEMFKESRERVLSPDAVLRKKYLRKLLRKNTPLSEALFLKEKNTVNAMSGGVLREYIRRKIKFL